MFKLEGHTTGQWWVAYSDDMSEFVMGFTEVGLVTEGRMSNFEHFDTESELEARVDELKGAGWYQEHNQPEPEEFPL